MTSVWETTSAPAAWSEPPNRIEHYQLIKELGRGGMGRVFLALDTRSGAEVALKLLSAELLGPGGLIRFRREFQLLLKLEHPHIVRVQESGFHAGLPYFTMERVAGDRLLDYARAAWAETPEARPAGLLDLARQLLQALDAIHSRGLVHRDVKPDNILVSSRGQAKLMDFGLAKDLDASRPYTRTGAFLGTLAYMPPEQILGSSDMDGRADLYSLGVTLYELATGRLPFEALTPADLLRRQRQTPPTPPRELAGWLPPRLDSLILRMLDPEPAGRPPSARDALDELASLLPAVPSSEPDGLDLGRLEAWLDRTLEARAARVAPLIRPACLAAACGAAVAAWASERLLPLLRLGRRPADALPFGVLRPLLERAAELAPGLASDDVGGLGVSAALELLEAAFRERLFLAHLEDLSTADALSLELLRRVADPTRAGRLRIVVGSAPDARQLVELLELGPEPLELTSAERPKSATAAEAAARRWKSLMDQSEACYTAGDFSGAATAAQAALEHADEAGGGRRRISTLANLGTLLGHTGDVAGAIPRYEEALELARRLGLAELEAIVLGNLGWLQLRRGGHGRARPELERALEAGRRLNDRSLEAASLLNLAELDLDADGWADAAPRLAQARAVAEAAGRRSEALHARILEALGLRRRGRWLEAEAGLRAALADAEALQEQARVERTLLELAELELERGRPSRAEGWLALLGGSEAGGAAAAEAAASGRPLIRLRGRRLAAELRISRAAWASAREELATLLDEAPRGEPIEALAVRLAWARWLGGVGRCREALRELDSVERTCRELEADALLPGVRFARELLLQELGAPPAESAARLARLREEAEARGLEIWGRRLRVRELATRQSLQPEPWREAAAGFARQEAIEDLARALLLWSGALEAAGRAGEALGVLEEARSLPLELPELDLWRDALLGRLDPSAAGGVHRREARLRLRSLASALPESDRLGFLSKLSIQSLRRLTL